MKSAAGSIRKKSQTRNGKTYTHWEARYTVGYDPGTGKQIQKTITGKTQKEVRKKLTEAMTALDNGIYIEPSKVPLSQWLDTWSSTYLLKQKPLTVKQYKGHIRNHIAPALGSIRLDQLRTNQIQAFYRKLYESLSPKTVKDIHGILHKALQQAVKSKMISQNPADGCEITKPTPPDIRPLEPDEIGLFLQTAESDDYRNLFITAIFTGMRQGELLGLSWDNVNFANGTIEICQQLLRIDKQWVLGTPKNGKSRTIAPAQLVMDALAAEKSRQDHLASQYAEIWQNENHLVFTTETGANLVTRTVDKHFKKILADAGLPNMRFHDLRHTFAVSSLMAGDDIKTLQSNLGHSTAAFTLEVYAHYTEQMRRESGNRMQAFADGILNKGNIRVT